ncbi:MAG: hypothetical protein AB7W16_15065 [Candidatus Obscuribacterales bacterium]
MSESDEFEYYDEYFSGRKMTAEQAADLRSELSDSPNDPSKRVELFGYHSSLGGNERFDRAFIDDFLWFVDNMPGMGGIVSSYFFMIGSGCSDDDYNYRGFSETPRRDNASGFVARSESGQA